jgi:hypothetical protein
MALEFPDEDPNIARADGRVRNNDPTTIPENSPLPTMDDHLVPVECVVCGGLNPHDTDYCTECGAVTSLAVAYQHQQAHRVHEDLNATLVTVLLQRGLLDDAVQAAHDAHLGGTLRRIATNDFTRASPAHAFLRR